MWIEIKKLGDILGGSDCHPPHGGCGLKYKDEKITTENVGHPPHGGCGLKLKDRDLLLS